VLIADYHLDGKNTGLDMLLRLRERVGLDVPGVVLSGDLPSVLRSIKSRSRRVTSRQAGGYPRRWWTRSPNSARQPKTSG
jgi:hypothetical protein